MLRVRTKEDTHDMVHRAQMFNNFFITGPCDEKSGNDEDGGTTSALHGLENIIGCRYWHSAFGWGDVPKKDRRTAAEWH